MELDIRRSWHCGYLPEDEWTPMNGKEMPPIRGKRPCEKLSDNEDDAKFEFVADVCPGWVVRQPGVTQAAEAYAAMECGELRTFYPRRPAAILDAAMLMKSSYSRHQSEQIEKSKQERGNDH